MPTLEDALLLAVEAHRDQTDPTGAPYILHPLRVMLSLEHDVERMVGLLHEIPGTPDFSLEDLRAAGYPTEVVEALDRLTPREGESFEEVVNRVKGNPVTCRVMIADIEDQMDAGRAERPAASRREEAERYWRHLNVLVQHCPRSP